MNALVSSKTLSAPPNPASPSARIGTNQSVSIVTFAPGDLIGSAQGGVDATHERRGRVGRIQRLIGIDLARQVGVGRHLPAGEVDRSQARLDHLHRLAAGEGAEGVDVVTLTDHPPQLLGHRLASVCSSGTSPAG
jgi:hypothetical protein